MAVSSGLCVDEVANSLLYLLGESPLQVTPFGYSYHSKKVVAVFGHQRLEICLQVCSVVSEISQLLLAFNRVPVGPAICVLV